jgi:hypothetical protein
MLNLRFNIRVPGSNRFAMLKNWHGSTPWLYKFWEVELYKSADILDFGLDITHRQSHAGVRLDLALFGYNFTATFYDSRHWNSVTQTWEHYYDKEDIL